MIRVIRVNPRQKFLTEPATRRLRTVIRSPGDAIVQPCGKDAAGPDKRRELPWERGKFLFLFDGADEERYRVVELHEVGHLVRSTGCERRFDKSRLDDRDIDAPMLNVEPDALEERRHPGLARTVGRRFRETANTGETRDRDKMPAFLGKHPRQNGMNRIHRTHEIRVDHSSDRLGVECLCLRIISADTSVRDEDIDPPELVGELIGGILNPGCISNVAWENASRCTSLFAPFCQIEQLIFPSCEKAKYRAAFGKFERKSFADAARRAG